MTILRMMGKIPLLSIYPLESYFLVSISLHMSRRLFPKVNQSHRYDFIASYHLLMAHSSSLPPPSMVRVIPSMDWPASPPKAQAKARARLQTTRRLRRLTKQDGAQGKGKAWARARRMGLIHGRSVPVSLV